MLLTILTPAWNRAHTLPRTYDSLRAQTRKDFVWLILDDGSTDGTAALVRDWQRRKSGFPIVYHALPHRGLPRTLNTGAALCRTPWLLRLDSDDCLLPEAVEYVLRRLPQVADRADFAGIAFGRCRPDGSWMGGKTPKIDPRLGHLDAPNTRRAEFDLDQDMCEVLRTGLLRQFPFPCWPGEDFAPEQLAYNAMALAGYRIRWFPERLCLCSYLPDGLTRNRSIVKENPMGYAMMHNQNLLLRRSFREKCRCAMQMTALALYAGHPGYLLRSNCPAATLLTLPLGILLAIRRHIQFGRS